MTDKKNEAVIVVDAWKHPYVHDTERYPRLEYECAAFGTYLDSVLDWLRTQYHIYHCGGGKALMDEIDWTPDTVLKHMHDKKLPGKPDLVFRKHKTVIFMHGCFWHSHTCKFGRVTPKSNKQFWKAKRDRTKQRDEENKEALEKLGWEVLTVWECELKDSGLLDQKLRKSFASFGSSA